MNILVTGATGLIGRHLIAKLRDKYQFTVLSRNPKHAATLLGPSVKLISAINHLSNLDNFDAVINLAGEPIANKRWRTAQKQRICHSRWQLTEKLVTLFNASQHPPGLFISGSAIGFYGRQDDTEISENFSHCYPEFSHQICKQWEQIALAAQSQHTRVCILRTGIVLANNGGALAKMLPPFRMGLGGPVASGKQYMSWIHIDDMVAGIEHLLTQTSCEGVYNFTAPEPVTNKVFSSQLASHLKRPCMLPMPAIALKLMLGELSDLLIYGQRVIPQRLLESGFVFLYPSLTSALAHLRL